MLLLRTLQVQPNLRPACTTASFTKQPRRSSVVRVCAIGNVNDPEKVKKNKEKKEQDSVWAEPKNKNPLEKKPILRGDPGTANEQGGVNPLEGAKEALEGAAEKAKGAVHGTKKADSD